MILIDNDIREKIIFLLGNLGFENFKFQKHDVFKFSKIIIVVNDIESFTDLNVAAIRYQLDFCGLYNKDDFNKYMFHYKNDEYELIFCKECCQMTNHLNNICQKCKK